MKKQEFIELLKEAVLNQALETGQSWVWVNGDKGSDFYDTFLRFKREAAQGNRNDEIKAFFIKLDASLTGVYAFTDTNKTKSCLVSIFDINKLMNVLIDKEINYDYNYNLAKTNRLNKANKTVKDFVDLAQHKQINDFSLNLFCNDENSLDVENKELTLNLSISEFTKLVAQYKAQLKRVRIVNLHNQQKTAKVLQSNKRGLKRCYSTTDKHLTGITSKVIA